MFTSKLFSLGAVLLSSNLALNAHAADSPSATLLVPSAIVGGGWNFAGASLVSASGCAATYVLQGKTGLAVNVPVTVTQSEANYIYRVSYRNSAISVGLNATCTARATNSAECTRDATFVSYDTDTRRRSGVRRTIVRTDRTTQHDKPTLTAATLTAAVTKLPVTANAGSMSVIQTCRGNPIASVTPTKNAAAAQATGVGGTVYKVMVVQAVMAVGGAMVL